MNVAGRGLSDGTASRRCAVKIEREVHQADFYHVWKIFHLDEARAPFEVNTSQFIRRAEEVLFWMGAPLNSTGEEDLWGR